jgi:hypothetical protein
MINQQRERSAFFYELCKRMTGKYEFKKPWPELTEKQRQILESRWPEKSQRPKIYDVTFKKRSPVKSGWTRRLPASWNLKLNDGTLVEGFDKFIQSERKRLNIPNPRQHAGRRLRPISWKPIELLDIQRNVRDRVLSTSEHSQISKVKKKWEKVNKK